VGVGVAVVVVVAMAVAATSTATAVLVEGPVRAVVVQGPVVAVVVLAPALALALWVRVVLSAGPALSLASAPTAATQARVWTGRGGPWPPLRAPCSRTVAHPRAPAPGGRPPGPPPAARGLEAQ
jgi:hypothetical protein